MFLAVSGVLVAPPFLVACSAEHPEWSREEALDYFSRTRLANKLDRDFLLDVKTVGNIRSKIHDERFRRHRNDAMSMRYLVEDELGGTGPGKTVFLYQEQMIERINGEPVVAPTAVRQTVLLDDPVSVLDVLAEEEEAPDATTSAAAAGATAAAANPSVAQAELLPRPQQQQQLPRPGAAPGDGKAKAPAKARAPAKANAPAKAKARP